MSIRFVILNGPPGAGKSTIAPLLCSFLRDKNLRVSTDSFARPMKHFIATLFAQQYHEMKKDEPKAELGGRSIRQFLIDLSENYMKIQYGPDIFGRMLYHRAMRDAPTPDFVIIDDGGFDSEVDAIGEPSNRLLVRVTRPGKDFSNDSRGYLAEPDWFLHNDGSVETLRGNIYALANELILLYRGDIVLK